MKCRAAENDGQAITLGNLEQRLTAVIDDDRQEVFARRF